MSAAVVQMSSAVVQPSVSAYDWAKIVRRDCRSCSAGSPKRIIRPITRPNRRLGFLKQFRIKTVLVANLSLGILSY